MFGNCPQVTQHLRDFKSWCASLKIILMTNSMYIILSLGQWQMWFIISVSSEKYVHVGYHVIQRDFVKSSRRKMVPPGDGSYDKWCSFAWCNLRSDLCVDLWVQEEVGTKLQNCGTQTSFSQQSELRRDVRKWHILFGSFFWWIKYIVDFRLTHFVNRKQVITKIFTTLK